VARKRPASSSIRVKSVALPEACVAATGVVDDGALHRKGGYFELAGARSVEFGFEGTAAKDYPLTLTFPLGLGLSMYDYQRVRAESDAEGRQRGRQPVPGRHVQYRDAVLS
jgi:hypothetical protein